MSEVTSTDIADERESGLTITSPDKIYEGTEIALVCTSDVGSQGTELYCTILN